jgi:hypothetical protein
MSMAKIIKAHLSITKPIQLKNALGEVFINLIQHKHFIEAKWQNHITADDVIAAGQFYLSYIKRHPSHKFLNDKSDVSGDWTDANTWLEFEWLPQVLNEGLRCIAHVHSDDMISQIAERDLFKIASPQLQMKDFSDHDQAINWLLAC